jgi:hypothetical protein
VAHWKWPWQGVQCKAAAGAEVAEPGAVVLVARGEELAGPVDAGAGRLAVDRCRDGPVEQAAEARDRATRPVRRRQRGRAGEEGKAAPSVPGHQVDPVGEGAPLYPGS